MLATGEWQVIEKEARLMLGRITGVFGVKGWVKVFSDTQPRENIVTYRDWWLQSRDGSWRACPLQRGQRSGKHVIAKLAGIDDRDAAEALIGQAIAIARDDLPELQDDEFYWTDLMGFTVHTVAGERLGSVQRMFETGAHDVMVVRDVAGDEILIPWVMGHFVERVEQAAGNIVVDWHRDWSE